MKKVLIGVGVLVIGALAAAALWYRQDLTAMVNCAEIVDEGFRPIANERVQRFLGKVQENTFNCRGPEEALVYRNTPWVDWQHYWATSDERSRSTFDYALLKRLGPNARGLDGALLDLEYQRIELLKFNLFDNYTYRDYVTGRDGIPGRSLQVWREMRLPAAHPRYEAVGGDAEQVCRGPLIRHRTLTGICNDLRNPAMGSTGQLFARNVQFEETFPELSDDELVRNRHGDRLGLLKPDPQVVSRRLFTRRQSQPELCNEGLGLPGHDKDANCDYRKADFFNVLAAFWIQFMTHDWFSHLDEGRNSAETMKVGCASHRVDDAEQPLTPEIVAELGCRPEDEMERSLVADEEPPPTFDHDGRTYLARAHKTFQNRVTAWWDASQIYGYDETSLRRVKRDPADPAKLLMLPRSERAGAGEQHGYLPHFEANDPINPAWAGQEAAAFPDNWTVGMSFYHNLFVREHNVFVDAFRARAAQMPDADSGLRDPANPDRVIPYREVTDDELYEVARLVIAAEIAKIHTIEWTTQLLYDEVLYEAMNANWHGLFRDNDLMSRITEKIVLDGIAESTNEDWRTQWYSVFASGSGIFGLGSGREGWDLKNVDHVNGGINHFGSPFNFPEEFVTVYRLHPLVPDLIEFREWNNDPNVIQSKVPVVESFRGKASAVMQEGGLANWALSMGRQRLGALSLQNHARFLQNLRMDRLQTPTKQIDVAALDLIRDRERGVPRFNEFRRQYGLKHLTSFDDFIDARLAEDSPIRQEQAEVVEILREVYGQHYCDSSKVITRSQLDDGRPINDCLGHPDGTLVDNVEDLDTVVGWLAETTRPHGFAISETQFQVFIINASRRLFSDRFFTSSFRPEFYTHFGVEWVNNNGPDGRIYEEGRPNGHRQEVSPLKRVMLRTMPELEEELQTVVNVFDPWARDRGSYYSLEWTPRPGAESDEAFTERPESLHAAAEDRD